MEQRHPSRSKDGLPPHAQYDDVEEGQPLLSNSRSPSPQLARDKLPDHGASYSLPSSSSAAGSATTSYQSFPRPPIPRSPSPTSTSVLERMNNFLKLAKNTEDEEEARERASCGWFYCEWREHLGHWLESRAVQYFFISLLILDIVLLTCELAFEEYFSNEEGEAWVLIAKDVFEYLSVGILLTFALEVVLLIVAFDVSFFTHPFYVIDAIIIGVSLFFDLYLKEALASFLVVFRFWRVIRVVHSIVAAEEERHGETRREKNHLQSELRAYQDTTAELQRTIEAKDSELARLRNKCAELERLLADATVHSIIPAEPSLVAAS